MGYCQLRPRTNEPYKQIPSEFFEQIVHVETAISFLLDEKCYLIRRKQRVLSTHNKVTNAERVSILLLIQLLFKNQGKNCSWRKS